jgi:hypothetical protein
MKLVSISEKVMLASKKERDEHINHMAIFLDMWLRSHHYHNKHNFVARAKTRISRVLCFVCNKREGKYLTALYFNIKVFYVVNVICQFYLLNGFLGMDYNSLGYNVLNGLSDSENWLESPRFPRVTLCDFRIRQLENIQRYVNNHEYICVISFMFYLQTRCFTRFSKFNIHSYSDKVYMTWYKLNASPNNSQPQKTAGKAPTYLWNDEMQRSLKMQTLIMFLNTWRFHIKSGVKQDVTFAVFYIITNLYNK